MFTENLFQKILIDPAVEGSDELYIISGFASATFLRKHLERIFKKELEVKINLLIGMNRKPRDHAAYIDLMSIYPNSFDGYYFEGRPEVHVKAYSWIKDGMPSIGFSGSSNYSQPGFFDTQQQNQMVEDDPNSIRDYFNNLLADSIHIKDYTHLDDEINVPEDLDSSSLQPGKGVWVKPNEIARISFLTKSTGEIANRDSLNWGQRPGREPNQGCLPIRGDAKTDGFLPPIGFTFTLLTDDGKTMDVTRQQDQGKVISTTYNNSEMGKYFRNRLNVPLGDFVKTEHLINYGRTDFLLKKIDQETFFLDFHKPI